MAAWATAIAVSRSSRPAMMAWLTHCSPSMAIVRRWVRCSACLRSVTSEVMAATWVCPLGRTVVVMRMESHLSSPSSMRTR